MPDESGLDLLKDLPSGMGVIMLSMHDSPALVEMALERGARGFLSKRCKPEDLVNAVRTVGSGGVYLMAEIAQKLARVAIDPLTRREREVAVLLSAWSSFIGAFIATCGMVLFAPLLAKWAIAFGPAP